MDEAGTSLQPHMAHRIFSFRVLITIIIAIIVASGAYLWFLSQTPVVPKTIDFRVTENDTIHTITDRLATDGIIKHRLFFYFTFYVFRDKTKINPGGYELSNTMSLRTIVNTLESNPANTYVVIPPGKSKEEIAHILADALGWNTLDRQFFSHTYAGMQWQQYQEVIEEFFQSEYDWNKTKTHTFLTLSALYYDSAYDFLKNMYEPGTYEIPLKASRAQVAGILIDQYRTEHPNDHLALIKSIDQESAKTVVNLIEEQMILMPDIVALPPMDLTIRQVGDRTHLLFSASYWNKGRGPLELIPDQKTRGRTDDHERDVYQRIYSLDGDYTERLSGKFLWHSPHLHYHFQDFAVYTLEAVDNPLALKQISGADKLSQKSTFCIRDSEPIDLSHPGANKGSSYTTCGKERQGISPGWADSYYYTYVDQKFDITGLPSGEYRLRIVINPLDRFDEITKDNNIGEVIFTIDTVNNKVHIVSEKTHGI